MEVGEVDGLRGAVVTDDGAFSLRVPYALGLSDSEAEFREQTPLGRAAPPSEWLVLPVDA